MTKSASLLETQSVIHDQIREKGHSHWQNIKATKGAKDAARSRETQLLVMRMKGAIREHGSADPKVNSQLAKCMESAKQKNIPNDTIKGILEKMVSKNANLKDDTYEVTGMNGLMVVVKVYTDNSKRTKQDVQGKVKKFGAGVVPNGSIMHSFELRGIVDVELGETDSRNHDDHIEWALEAEADDVSMETNDDGIDILQFQCDPQRVSSVKNCLESKDMNVIYSDAVYLPTNPVKMSQENMDIIDKLIDKIREVEEVEGVFVNAELERDRKSVV